MTVADIITEYKQIRALEYEKTSGKEWSDDSVMVDAEYEEWQKQIGIEKNG